MTLAQLRCLLAIVDAGMNITLAAERMNATQPGLSKQLKQLEDQLGVPIFLRRGRNLERLTSAGQGIVERARGTVAQADNIRAFAANQRSGDSGTLLIETTHIQAEFVLPDALISLRRRFPDVDVSFSFAADADDPGRRSPDADLMIFSTDGIAPAGDVAIPLFRWDPVALVPVGHAIARQRAAPTLERLAEYPLITYDTSRAAPLSIARSFLDAGLSPRFAYTVRDAGVTKAAVRGGVGIGLLAEMAVGGPGDIGLSVVPLAGLFPRCTTWAVLRRDQVLRDYTTHLVALLSGLTPRSIQRMVDGEAVPLDQANVPLWSERRSLSRLSAA